MLLLVLYFPIFFFHSLSFFFIILISNNDLTNTISIFIMILLGITTSINIYSLLLRILPPFNDEKCLGSFRDKYGCRLSGVRSLLLTAQQLKLDVCGVWWVFHYAWRALQEVIRQYDSCNTGELDRHAQHQQPCLASRTLRVIVRQEQPVLSGTHWSSFAHRQMSVVLCLRRFPMKIENCHIRHQRPLKVHQRPPR